MSAVSQVAEATTPPSRQTMLAETGADFIDVTESPQEHRVLGYIGGKLCGAVAKITGMTYDNYDKKDEPDLSKLKLDFQSEKESHSFYLGDLAKEMPNLRGLNGTKPLTIFMHGFTDDPTQTNFNLINEALQSTKHYNILGLDAGSLLKWMYLRATAYVRFIGDKLGDTLAAMVRQGLDRKRIHLIGHSLGAHIAGFAGGRFRQITGKKIGRVTGLDPAGPCFATINETYRLNHRHAEFVDVIHTNAGGYGISVEDLVGHVDFFPNGGSKQPGCFKTSLSTCSHSRAVELYAESITNQTAFYGVKCRDLNKWYKKQCTDTFRVMGHDASSQIRGQFYLRTEEHEPYGLGMDGVYYKKSGWWFWGESRANIEINDDRRKMGYIS